MGGMVLETNMNEIVAQIEAQNRLEKSEVSAQLSWPVCALGMFYTPFFLESVKAHGFEGQVRRMQKVCMEKPDSTGRQAAAGGCGLCLWLVILPLKATRSRPSTPSPIAVGFPSLCAR